MQPKHPIGVRFAAETIRQIHDLAAWWGLGPRHTTEVIMRCIERVWNQERQNHDTKPD